MAEEKNETVVKAEANEDNASLDLDSQIQSAMRARGAHIKEQASSLTLEGVRRLLEKDLDLEQYALDAHKSVVKRFLEELLEGSNDGNDQKNDEEAGDKKNDTDDCKSNVSKEEQTISSEAPLESNDASESIDKEKEKLDDTPVLGLLKDFKKTKVEADESKEVAEKKALNNETIIKALKKRAKYLKANSEQLTLAGLRRLLEEDLELEAHSLDSYKKFIREQVDKILIPTKVSPPASNVKKNVAKKPQGKVAKKVRIEDDGSDSADSESESDEDEVKPKKRKVMKGKASNEPKKRKKPAKDLKVSGKRIKTAEKSAEDNSDDGDEDEKGNSSESSAEKSTKKKVVSIPPAYGKRVEHLKSVIKSCGMSVPPALYKKIKQVPENKRESQLIKDLEDMLSKEGLSANPTEKEIKEVRKKKERAKELEGIDTSNIVSSTRRRSSASYVPPPKPKIPIESGSEDSEDEDEDDDEDDDENGNNDGSQSEESNVDDDDDDVNSD